MLKYRKFIVIILKRGDVYATSIKYHRKNNF